MSYMQLEIPMLPVSYYGNTICRPQRLSRLPGEAIDAEYCPWLMLLPGGNYGFFLRTRRWIKLAMADLSEPEYGNDFENPMFPKRSKNTIRSLALTHEQPSDRSSTASIGSGINLIKGKGTGLIFLRHGEPRVSKTSSSHDSLTHSWRHPISDHQRSWGDRP